jgi:RNA polymerase sigma-70 factor (ECF subfamily)
MPKRAHVDQRHLRVVVDDESREGAGPPLSDDELIDAFERGDRRTAELLYDRLDNVVGATLVKVLGGRGQDHEDLVQAAFEQILLTLAHRKFARACKLSSWAVSLTTNVALNAIRKRQQERRYVEAGADVNAIKRECPSETNPDQRVMLATLRQKLAELAPPTATVVVLHDVMGHDLAEISVLTGLSVSAAQSRLVRGRAELRTRLQSSFPGARQ